MKTILMALLLSITLSGAAHAEVSWNNFSAPQEMKYEVDHLLKTECPIMMSQETFEVIDLKKDVVSQTNALFTVELKGRGYGSGDPDHHFIIQVSEDNRYHDPEAYHVEEFIVLAECH